MKFFLILSMGLSIIILIVLQYKQKEDRNDFLVTSIPSVPFKWGLFWWLNSFGITFLIFTFLLFIGGQKFNNFSPSEGIIGGAILMIFFVATAEELIFRGLLFGNLKKYVNSKINSEDASIFISATVAAILFSLIHIVRANYEPFDFILAGLVGFVWAILVSKTNLWVAIGSHAGYNIFVILS